MNLTPNQLVAYNLQRIRRVQGLTQEEAAERLQPHIGSLWSKAVWSAAETSIQSVRRREFTADEIVAFARAFEVPIAWFFLPPDVGDLGVRRNSQTPDLLDLLFGTGVGYERVWDRVRHLIENSPPTLQARRRGLAGAWLGRRFRELLELRMGSINDLVGHLDKLAKALVEVGQEAVSDAVDRETSPKAKGHRK